MGRRIQAVGGASPREGGTQLEQMQPAASPHEAQEIGLQVRDSSS